MYSMPQQAVTNGYWKMEYFRPQPTPFETSPCSQPCASSRRVAIAGTVRDRMPSRAPVENALLPDVDEAGDEGRGEDPHRHEAGPAEAGVARAREQEDRPWIDEDRLDVEDDEEDRDDIELHAEALPSRADPRGAALERGVLCRAVPPGTEQASDRQHDDREQQRHEQDDADRKVRLQGGHRVAGDPGKAPLSACAPWDCQRDSSP